MGNQTAADILRQVAEQQREGNLLPINEYKPGSSEYSATHPNALSDGDDKGKDAIGSDTDIKTRTQVVGVNTYSANNPYQTPE